MAKATVEQVKQMAELACFYVTPQGLWLRMQFCEEDYFQALDENSGEEYDIEYQYVSEDEDPHFEALVTMPIPT